jgi:transcriptional regulator with XRE-family HTH domain
VTGFGNPENAPEEIRPWVEQLHTLAAASGLPSQARLAAALHVGKATLSRYLTGERMPSRSTVAKLAELARQNGEAVDEPALFRAYESAESILARRRRAGRASAEVDVPEEGASPTSRRRVPTFVRSAIAALIAAAVGFGIAAYSGAFRANDPQSPGSSTKCDGTSCKGKNHQDQGCSADAQALDSNDEAGVVIEVMYSPACQAAWGKGKGVPADAVVKITSDSSTPQRARGKPEPNENTTKPTRMLPAPVGTLLRACITTTDAQKICTEQVEVPSAE